MSWDQELAQINDAIAQLPSNTSPAQELADAQARLAAQRAAAGGNARSQHRITTHGVGNGRTMVRLDFSVTFVNVPLVTTGVVMLSNAVDMAQLPLCTIGVYRWITDRRGLYVGAHVWAAVGLTRDTSGGAEPVSPTAKAYVLEHHITFEANAIRDVSYDAIMDDGQ